MDAQAKAIIDANPIATPPAPGTPPTWRPVPPELKALHEQHEALIQSEVSNLKSALGPDAAERLETFLQNRQATHATTPASFPSPTLGQIQQNLDQAAQKVKEAQQ